MADETAKETEEQPTETKREGNVVSVRRVVSRNITRVEQAQRAGEPVDAEALYPNAPKPQKSLDYRPKMVQLKRKHASQQKSKPAGMSDIKF